MPFACAAFGAFGAAWAFARVVGDTSAFRCASAFGIASAFGAAFAFGADSAFALGVAAPSGRRVWDEDAGAFFVACAAFFGSFRASDGRGGGARSAATAGRSARGGGGVLVACGRCAETFGSSKVRRIICPARRKALVPSTCASSSIDSTTTLMNICAPTTTATSAPRRHRRLQKAPTPRDRDRGALSRGFSSLSPLEMNARGALRPS